MGTWIEIRLPVSVHACPDVVPLVGTWIEIWYGYSEEEGQDVVPLVGTWIEIIRAGNGSS